MGKPYRPSGAGGKASEDANGAMTSFGCLADESRSTPILRIVPIVERFHSISVSRAKMRVGFDLS